jgi:DNA ligase-1
MPHNWITKLNETNSRNDKEATIAEALSASKLGATDAKTFLTCAWYAYNPYVTFNSKQVPETAGYSGEDNDFNRFFELLHDLDNRKVTGNAAKAEIEQVSVGFDSDTWNLLCRPTILKDLRIGATVNTFNKILKGSSYDIPIFECQLATDSAKHPQKLKGKKRLEPKLDGIRIIALVKAGLTIDKKSTVEIFSRNGKPLNNFPHIEQQLIDAAPIFAKIFKNPTKHFVIDAEVVSDNFQALMKQAQRKTNIDTSDSVLSIFDIIPTDEFITGICNTPQSKRSEDWLGSVKDTINEKYTSLVVIDGLTVDLDLKSDVILMEEYAAKQVELGYEGIMIKDVDAPYVCKRRTNWMKWKPTITVDLTVVDIEEGTGRNSGRLGALVCKGTDQGCYIEVNVGGGFSDNQRDEFWNEQGSIVGQIVEVKADAVTQNQDGTYSLRFPRFVRFRGFAPGEKL